MFLPKQALFMNYYLKKNLQIFKEVIVSVIVDAFAFRLDAPFVDPDGWQTGLEPHPLP